MRIKRCKTSILADHKHIVEQQSDPNAAIGSAEQSVKKRKAGFVRF